MAGGDTTLTSPVRFEDIIRTARTEAELTQQELADRLNVRQSTVSAWEKAVARPKVEMLVAISQVLRVDLAVLTAAAAVPIVD